MKQLLFILIAISLLLTMGTLYAQEPGAKETVQFYRTS